LTDIWFHNRLFGKGLFIDKDGDVYYGEDDKAGQAGNSDKK
jgi:hypothetical protein